MWVSGQHTLPGGVSARGSGMELDGVKGPFQLKRFCDPKLMFSGTYWHLNQKMSPTVLKAAHHEPG